MTWKKREKVTLAKDLAQIAYENDITMYSCCDLVDQNIKKAHRVDGDLIYKLFPNKPRQTKLHPQGPSVAV